MTQVSVINALMIGRYDGVMPIPELLRLGEFGVGALDHLDDRMTTFAVVTRFKRDGEFPCPNVASLADLDTRLDGTLPQKNNFVAIRVDGRFDSITLRSVHRQEPPYRPLAEVAKSQSVWTRRDLVGTLVGIRCPSWVGGLNVPGYHWHFLSDDRKVGGHVLECRFREGRVRHDVCHDWDVKLPRSGRFNEADLTQDLGQALKRVESSRGPAPHDGPDGW